MASGEKILGGSNLGSDASLDLFGTPATNLGIMDTKLISFKSANAYNIEGNIKLRICGAGTMYIDLREIHLKSMVRIVWQGGVSILPKPRAPTGSGSSSIPEISG